MHKYPKFYTGKRNTDIEAMPEALHKRADDKLNGANTHEEHCKKKKRTRVEAVLMNIRNRNKTERERESKSKGQEWQESGNKQT